MPWARDPGESARPRNNGRRQILPSAGANTSASQRYKISGLNPHGLLPWYLRFAPPGRPENGKTLYWPVCSTLVQAGFAPAGWQ